MKSDDQELEHVLRRAFRLDGSQAGPSGDFEARVLASLPERGRWLLPAPLNRGLRALELAAVVVIAAAAIVVLPLVNRPGGAPVSPTNSVDVGGGSPSVPPTSLAHARIWDLGFDYPASWRVVGSPMAPTTLYGLSIAALGSVGTEEVVETCAYPSPRPGFSGHLGQVCETTWDPAAEVQVRFEWDGRDEAWSVWKAVSGQAPADDSLVIAGLPARARTSTDGRVPGTDEVIPGADRITIWDVASRERMWWSFRITAVVRGPNAEALQSQVDTMLASAAFSPRVEPLVDTAATRAEALRAGLGEMRDQADGTPPARDHNPDMSAACFSDVPGTTTEATIDGTVFIAHRLTHALKVRCTSLIEVTPFQMWKMTLRYDWDAGGGKPAGSASLVVVLLPVLGSGTGGDMYGVAGMPYLVALPLDP
jgi:hypothetical protein